MNDVVAQTAIEAHMVRGELKQQELPPCVYHKLLHTQYMVHTEYGTPKLISLLRESLVIPDNTVAYAILASFPGLLTPAFVACSTPTIVLQATNTGVRRPGNEANAIFGIACPCYSYLYL